MTFILAGLLIGVIMAGWFGYERQRDAYERLVRIMESDREQARNEAQVFRNLLFPVLCKTPQANPVAAPMAEATAVQMSREEVMQSRMPFRKKFNMLRRMGNIKQNRIDTLAEAIDSARKL